MRLIAATYFLRGGRPEWHIRGDCIPLLNGKCDFTTEDGVEHSIDTRWDLIIAHPPCTHLAVSGARWFTEGTKPLWLKFDAAAFFMKFVAADCERIAIENPVGVMSTLYRKPDQIINPYEFGHPVAKKTCLWLKNLPLLQPTEVVEPDIVHAGKRNSGFSGAMWHAVDENGKIIPWNDPRTAKARSRTFHGIAIAFAQQWAGDIRDKE